MSKRYDPKTIAIFEAIGSYFVDVFYNGHYQLAVERVEAGNAKSETDAYRAIIMSYMDGVGSRPDAYAMVIEKIHSYYREACGFGSISFADFEDKLLSQMIPPDFYKSFTEANKDNALRGVINTVVQRFGEFAVSKDALTKVIDKHSAHEINVPYMQSKILNILFAQRDEYYVKFAKSISKRSGGRNVDVRHLDELENRLQKANNENQHLQSELESAVRIISQLSIKIKQQDMEIKKLQAWQTQSLRVAPDQVAYPRTVKHADERYPPKSSRVDDSQRNVSVGRSNYRSSPDPRGRDRTESNLWNSSLRNEPILSNKKIPKTDAREFYGKSKQSESTRIANNIDDSPAELPSVDAENNPWGVPDALMFGQAGEHHQATSDSLTYRDTSEFDHRSECDVSPGVKASAPIFNDASDTESDDSSFSEDEDARADRLRREKTAKMAMSRSLDVSKASSASRHVGISETGGASWKTK